jgi:1-acyl-sn-glycerol-3-phosphate acyltransferase
MKILKDILARILALWALITFMLTFLIIFIPSMLSWLMPIRSGQHYFVIVARVWMHIWLRLVGCPFKIKGTENFIKGETYVVTFNHNSLLDVPLSAPFVPGPNKTIAKSSFAKVPLFGFFYMKGALLVDRNSEASRRESFDRMKNVLKQGIHMCIYPEGTRNRTNEPLKKFYDGAFKLAVDSGKSIIPTVIFNTKKVLPVNKAFWFWPHRLEMHFLPAISGEGLRSDQLKEKVFTTMSSYYVAHSTK